MPLRSRALCACWDLCFLRGPSGLVPAGPERANGTKHRRGQIEEKGLIFSSLFHMELEAALAHCLGVSAVPRCWLCPVSKEWLCFAFPREAERSRAYFWGQEAGRSCWGRAASGCWGGWGRQSAGCLQRSSVRGVGGLQPFVMCCKWCQRLWLRRLDGCSGAWLVSL